MPRPRHIFAALGNPDSWPRNVAAARKRLQPFVACSPLSPLPIGHLALLSIGFAAATITTIVGAVAAAFYAAAGSDIDAFGAPPRCCWAAASR